jgi:hypothetical protein
MAKIKAARGVKKKKKSALDAIPCLFLVVSGIVLLSLLFYAVARSAGS